MIILSITTLLFVLCLVYLLLYFSYPIYHYERYKVLKMLQSIFNDNDTIIIKSPFIKYDYIMYNELYQYVYITEYSQGCFYCTHHNNSTYLPVPIKLSKHYRLYNDIMMMKNRKVYNIVFNKGDSYSVVITNVERILKEKKRIENIKNILK